jgi:hypothetical protein
MEQTKVSFEDNIVRMFYLFKENVLPAWSVYNKNIVFKGYFGLFHVSDDLIILGFLTCAKMLCPIRIYISYKYISCMYVYVYNNNKNKIDFLHENFVIYFLHFSQISDRKLKGQIIYFWHLSAGRFIKKKFYKIFE